MTRPGSNLLRGSDLGDQFSALCRFKLIWRSLFCGPTARRWLIQSVATLSLLLVGLPAQAGTAYYFFPLLGTLPSGCSLDILSTSSYTCGVVALGVGDTINIGLIKPVTITFNGAFTAPDNLVNAGGSASDLILVVKGVLTLGGNTVINANATGYAAVNFDIGGTLHGNLTTIGTPGVVTLAGNNSVGGNILTDAGAVDVGGSSTVGGGIATQAGVVTLLTNVKVGGDISTVAGGISIEDGSSTCGSVISTGAGIVTLTTNIQIGGDIRTVAGGITVGIGGTVVGDILVTGAGVVTLTGDNVGGKIATTAGGITLTDTRVGGSVKSSGGGVVTMTNSKDNDTTLVVLAPPGCQVAPPPGSAAGSFECLETGTNSPWVATARKPLYTKLVSTDFKIDIAALKTDGTLEGNYVAAGGNPKYAMVELFDNTTPPANCTAYANPQASQTVTFTSGSYSGAPGRTLTGKFNLSSAYKKLLCRVRECADNACTSFTATAAACSSDEFSVRPMGFSLSTTATNAASDGTPIFKAGSGAFSLNTTAGLYNLTANTIPQALSAVTTYIGAPSLGVLDTSPMGTYPVLVGAWTAGSLGPLAAAVPGTGTSTNSLTYSEVGLFKLAGYWPNTASYSAGDDTSARGIYDDTWSAVDSASGKNDCVVGSYSNKLVGNKYGCNFGLVVDQVFGRFTPDHFLVTPGAVTNRQASTCTPASTFSYAGEELQLKDFKLTATNGLAIPTTTQNYVGTFARFDGSAIGNFGFAAVDLADAIAPLAASAFVNGSGAGQFALVSSSGSWASGIGTFSANVKLNRAAAPTGPYESFRIGIEPLDADLVSVLPADKNLDISAPADAINDKVLLGSTKVRYGRLRMQNAYGSELLGLSLPFEVQYWAGSYYVTNTQDSCTNISLSSITMGNYNKQLSACKTQLTPTGSVTMDKGKLLAPGIVLTQPGAGNAGSVDLTLNLGSATGNTCVGVGAASSESLANPANMPWFGTTNTTVRATFGIYKSRLIYRRENY